jgi:WD40 repeat protein
MRNKFHFILIFFLLTALSINSQTVNDNGKVLLSKFETPDHRIQDVAFSPDGRMIAAGYGFYDEGGITIWDITSRKVIATLLEKESKKGGINKTAFSKDGKLFAAADSKGNVWIWKIGDWRNYKKIINDKGDANGLVFSPDSLKLAFSSEENTLVYDFTSNKVDVIAAGEKDSNEFDGISFTPDGKYIVVSGRKGTQTWDVQTKNFINDWKNPAFNFFSQLSPDGRYFIYGGGAIYGEKSVEIRHFPDGKKIKELNDFRNGIFALAISDSGKYFALAGGTYGGEGTFSLWRFDEIKELGFATFGDSPVKGLAFSGDEKMLAVGSDDGYVLIYDTERFRGGETKQQTEKLCGEIKNEGGKTFITALSKIPGIMTQDFVYPWTLEIANSDAVKDSVGLPVVFQNWAIESSSADDKARINELKPLLSKDQNKSNYIVFGIGENPGFGYVIKIFNNGNFAAANRSGKCLSYGNLSQLKTGYQTVKQRLLDEKFLSIPREPLTIGADHFRTEFIEITTDGVSEIRTDADSFELLMKEKGKTKKREAFSQISTKEQGFVDSLLKAGFR